MADQYLITLLSNTLSTTNSPSEADKKQIDGLLVRFPFFVPARFAAYANSSSTKKDNLEAYAKLYPYQTNWFQLRDFMNGVRPKYIKHSEKSKQDIESTTQAEIKKGIVEPNLKVESSIVEVAEKVNIENKKDTSASNISATIIEANQNKNELDDIIVQPVSADDYFLHQGIKVPDEIPMDVDSLGDNQDENIDIRDKSLMVMMSFSDWLVHFKKSSEKQKADIEDQKAVKAMWQKEKLAAALEEENDEIPENVFEMAVNSIAKEEGLASESLAEIYIKQQKYDKAIDMYKKLSLRNPQKNAYFARKIEEVLKEKQS